MANALFRYEVADSAGKTLTGAMSAPDEATVQSRLAQQGYRVVLFVPPQGAVQAASVTAAAPRRYRGTVGPSDKALFFRQLASLIRSGISPFSALDDLGPRTVNPLIRQAAAEMCLKARMGQPISDAMDLYPGLFDPHIVATVRAGETGGFLEIALDEIALEAEQELAFYKGMWLPKVLVLQEVLALALVQPLFPTLFPDNEPLRFFGLVFLRNIPIAVALVLLVRWLWARLHAPDQAGRRDRWTLRIPVFGDLSRQRSLAAFIRMLRRLYGAGLMPINAWEGAAHVVPNVVLRAKLADARAMMQQGVPLHEAFRATGLFASEAEQLIATGMMSGEVVEMLDRVAEFYQNNVQRALESSRFWMYRLAFALFLATMGAALIIMARTYFQSVFDFTKDWA
ncbi:MAG: type II secretion system F family protein [Armatimonadetes bacterium]|nr:type II secretion system F family protein [Armatimonadota bacterium]